MIKSSPISIPNLHLVPPEAQQMLVENWGIHEKDYG